MKYKEWEGGKENAAFSKEKQLGRGDLEVRHVKRIRSHQRNMTKKTYPVSSDLIPMNQANWGHRNWVGLLGLHASCPFLATRFESPYWKASWCSGASEAWVQIQPCNWGKVAWCQQNLNSHLKAWPPILWLNLYEGETGDDSIKENG